MRKARPLRRLAHLLVKDPDPMLSHAEIMLRDRNRVGDVRVG